MKLTQKQMCKFSDYFDKKYDLQLSLKTILKRLLLSNSVVLKIMQWIDDKREDVVLTNIVFKQELNDLLSCLCGDPQVDEVTLVMYPF